MNRKNPSKRPPPSYVEGKLRDPEIERKQVGEFNRSDLDRLLGRTITKKKPSEEGRS